MRYNPKAKLDQSQVDFANKYRHYFDFDAKVRQFDAKHHPGPSGTVSIFGDGRRIAPASRQETARYKAMAKKLRKNYG